MQYHHVGWSKSRTFWTQSAWSPMKMLTAAVWEPVFCSTTFLMTRIYIFWDAAQVTAKYSICSNNNRNKKNKLLRASDWDKETINSVKLNCKFLFWSLIRRSQHSIDKIAWDKIAWVMGARCVQAKEVLCLQGKRFSYRSQQSVER